MRRSILTSLLLVFALTATADDFAYVFSSGGRALITGNMDLDRTLSMKDRYSREGEFLWARRNGRAYLIRDKATIAEARAAFRDADALHAEYERLAARMRPVEEKERKLERQIDRLGDDLSDRDDLSRSERRQMEERLRELEVQMKPVARELRTLEAEEERLDDLEEKIVEVAEVELRKIIDRAVRKGVAEPVR